MTLAKISVDERRAAASLLAELRSAGVTFGDTTIVQRDIASGRLSVAWNGCTAQRLPGGRLIAARRRPDGGIDVCDLSAPPHTWARLFA